MAPSEINKILDAMVLIVDTREQDTPQLRQRLESAHCEFKRGKVDFGDYSASFPLPDGGTLDLTQKVSIERKMSIDELAMCFGRERPRFEREFERAKKAGAKLYLLVENGDWGNIFSHKYASLMKPESLLASIFAYLARYNCQLIFCAPGESGKLIKAILRYEGRERLEGMLND